MKSKIDINAMLVTAVRDRSEEQVKQLLEKGADPNHKLSDDLSILHIAARYSNEAIVGLLIEAGAEINARDREGRTPLNDAVAYGERSTCERLIDMGADLDNVDRWGARPYGKMEADSMKAQSLARLLERRHLSERSPSDGTGTSDRKGASR
jgi:ankyrin repeat protein